MFHPQMNDSLAFDGRKCGIFFFPFFLFFFPLSIAAIFLFLIPPELDGGAAVATRSHLFPLLLCDGQTGRLAGSWPTSRLLKASSFFSRVLSACDSHQRLLLLFPRSGDVFQRENPLRPFLRSLPLGPPTPARSLQTPRAVGSKSTPPPPPDSTKFN